MSSIYNAAEYPQGVPSPYRGQVHPYPSYEHGPDYTRPTFGMPYVRQPFNVLEGLGGAGPWLARVNRSGMPTVQPQPNPYYPHWPEVLGQTPGDEAARSALFRGVMTSLGLGAALGLFVGATAFDKPSAARYAETTLAGAMSVGLISFIPVFVAAQGARR